MLKASLVFLGFLVYCVSSLGGMGSHGSDMWVSKKNCPIVLWKYEQNCRATQLQHECKKEFHTPDKRVIKLKDVPKLPWCPNVKKCNLPVHPCQDLNGKDNHDVTTNHQKQIVSLIGSFV